MPELPGWSRGVAGGLFLAVTLGALTLVLAAPPPRRVDIGGPGDAYLAMSFYLPEGPGTASFRWSGPNSALALPAVAAEALVLRLRLREAAPGQALTLAVAEQAPLRLNEASAEWRVYHLLLAVEPGRGQMARLVAEPLQQRSDDPRELGVALDEVMLRPIAGGSAALAAAFGRALLLGWASALAGVAVWLALRGWVGILWHAERWGLLGSALAAVGLTLRASYDPYGLGWLLPLQIPHLLAATLALAAAGTAPPLLARSPRLGAGVRRLLPLALGLTLAHLALGAPLPALARGIAALTILWAPGWLLTLALLDHERDQTARFVLGLCGALALQVLILLAGALAGVPLGGTGLIVICDGLTLSAAILYMRGQAAGRPAPRFSPRVGTTLALVLLLAAALRLPTLGGAELHDDEASVLIAATRVVAGNGEILLTQLKGPAQILMPAGPLALTGQLTEQTARLPFAAAGLGTVLAGFALGRRLAAPAGVVAGLLAALVLALDGLLIGFSRIVQYQSLVVLLSLGALWCCWRFSTGAPGQRRYLLCAAVLMAVALLGHYDAIYVLPALLCLALAGTARQRLPLRARAVTLGLPLALGTALLASFYLPFALHPHAAEVLAHLGERTGQDGGPAIVNNIGSSYVLAGFYSSYAQLWLVGLLIAGGLVAWLASHGRPRWLAIGTLSLAAIGVGDLLHGPEARLVATGAPALIYLALLLGVIAYGPCTPEGLRAPLIWLRAGGLTMLFLIAEPRTHVYVMVAPAALLAGRFGAELLGAVPRRWAPQIPGALAVALVLAALAGGLRQHTIYVRQSPEYARSYPAARLATGGPAEAPVDLQARFGFPGRDGWKAVRELMEQGLLRGAFASNQSGEVVAWYTGGTQRCGRTPDYYLIALAAPNPAIPAGYHRLGSVQASGRDQLVIYSREPPDGPPRIFALEDYIASFDARPVGTIPTAEEVCNRAVAGRAG